MADTQPPRVDNEIVQMWRRDGRLYAIAGFLVGVMLFPLLASLGSDRLTGFLQELVPELVGIGLTVFLIDRIIQRRDERNAEAALKRQLVMDAASTSNEKAKDAIHQLRNNGWLVGKQSLLRGAKLSGANLQKAKLNGASLHEVVLDDADLQGIELYKANLQQAFLRKANLRGANFSFANLRNARFQKAEFNEETILPNGSYWTQETDMRRFTDPNHPDFWKPSWVKGVEE